MSSFNLTMDAAFRESAELELRCLYLLLEGKENDTEVTAAEDRMTVLWEQLDEDQRRSLNGKGSDLSWVRRRGGPPPRGRKNVEDVTATERQELAAAMEAKDWPKVLHYLRLCAPDFSVVALANLRGKAYEDLGLRTYASVFYAMAADLDPGNIDTKLKAISTATPENAIQPAPN
jgi:hypothetical protein